MSKKSMSLIGILAVLVMVLSAFVPAAPAAATGGEVYYLNFKPEVAEIYAKIGEAYKAETGVH